MSRARPRSDGQGLVEFALTLPVYVFVIFIMADLFIWSNHRELSQNAITVLANIAAREEPGWQSLVNEENARTGCHASPLQPDVNYPGGDVPGGRILLTWHCHYQSLTPPNVTFGYTVQGEGLRKEAPSASPSPTASP